MDSWYDRWQLEIAGVVLALGIATLCWALSILAGGL